MSAVRVEESKEGAVNAGIQPRTHRPSDRTAFRILHDGVPRAENRLHRIHRGCISARRLFQSSAHYTEPHDTRNITSPNANITSSTATCSCTVTTARRCLRHQPHRVAMRPTYWRPDKTFLGSHSHSIYCMKKSRDALGMQQSADHRVEYTDRVKRCHRNFIERIRCGIIAKIIVVPTILRVVSHIW